MHTYILPYLYRPERVAFVLGPLHLVLLDDNDDDIVGGIDSQVSASSHTQAHSQVT